jgi:hypothetical protein
MWLPRSRLRMLICFVAIVTLLIFLPIVWRLVSLEWVDDAYALWGAGDMVVSYMGDHDGRWPKGWADLRPYFDAGGGRIGGWSFERYQTRIMIRWDVDPATLEAAAKTNPRSTFRVISASNLLAGSIAGNEPNEILYRYLRQKPRR